MYLSYAAAALAVIGFLFNIFQSFVNINFGVIAIRYGFMGVTGFMGLAFDNAAIFQQIASMNAGYGTPEYSVPFSFYVLMLMAYIVMFIPPVSAVIGIVKAYRRRGGLVPFAVSAAGCFLMLITLRIIVSYISDMNRRQALWFIRQCCTSFRYSGRYSMQGRQYVYILTRELVL